MKKIKSEYIPDQDKSIWLLFDLSNGHAPIKRYVWWFNSKREAVKHKKFQESNENNVKLSKPIRYTPTDSIEYHT